MILCIDSSIWERGDIIAAFAAISVIVIFIVERLITSNSNRKEYKRRWLSEVLISPNMDDISFFFDHCVELYRKACTRLRNEDGKILHTDFNLVLTEELGNLSGIKREFELRFIQPIQYLYPLIGCNLTNWTLKIQDEFSTRLTNYKFSDEDIVDFQSVVLDIKALWMKCLYGTKDNESREMARLIQSYTSAPRNIS